MRKRALSEREKRINAFYKFLLENDVFIEYRENVRRYKYSTLRNVFNNEISHWITWAFNWIETKEGMDYWCNLAVMWDNYRREKGIE